MSRPPVLGDDKQFLSLLANNQVMLGNIIRYCEERLETEEQKLNQMARLALVQPEDKPRALHQMGRVELARELLSYMRCYLKR